MAMFERFTDRSRRVVVLAQEAARVLNHNYIGSEHLLLGLLQEGEGTAASALRALGVSLEAVRQQVEEIVGTGHQAPAGTIPFTPRVKRILELALREALRMGHNYIGTEHILLGLIREGEGVAAQVMARLGVSRDEVRTTVADLLTADLAGVAGHPAGTGAGDAPAPSSPALEQFGHNLTADAHAGALDPVVGRDREIEQVVQILACRRKNNPILTGEPGVGKTAVVEGLAQRIAAGDVPAGLAGRQLYSLDLAALVAGSRYRGDFEERLRKVIREIRSRRDVIVFIDEIHTLVGAGAAEGAIDAAAMLKPMLARGELQTIGATTTEEYRRYIGRDGALERRFQQVVVAEPTAREAVAILRGLRRGYEAHHGVTYTDEALSAAVGLAERYVPDRRLPDKAIDLLDRSGARAGIASAAPDGVPEVGPDQIAEVLAAWTGIPLGALTAGEATRLLGLEAALHRRLVGQEHAVRAVARAIRRARAGLSDPRRPTASFIFAGPSGVGKSSLAKALAEQLFGTEEALIQLDMSEYHDHHTVARLVGAPPGYVGHDDGGQLTERVRRRPFSVVLFDEIEKAHPDVFNALLQILEDGHLTDAQGRRADFRHTVLILTTNLGTATTPAGFALPAAQLAPPAAQPVPPAATAPPATQSAPPATQSAPPGIQPVRAAATAAPTPPAATAPPAPSLVAAPAGTGQAAAVPAQAAQSGEAASDEAACAAAPANDATSAEATSAAAPAAEATSAEATAAEATAAGPYARDLRRHFRVEFLNRIDDVLVFHPLTAAQLVAIVDLHLSRVTAQLNDRGITLTVTDRARRHLAAAGADPALGARPLRRTIQRELEDELSTRLLQSALNPGDTITVDAVPPGTLTFTTTSTITTTSTTRSAISTRTATTTSPTDRDPVATQL